MLVVYLVKEYNLSRNLCVYYLNGQFVPITEYNFPSLTNTSRHATPPKLLVRLFYCPHKAGTFRSEETELIDNNSLDFIIWYI